MHKQRVAVVQTRRPAPGLRAWLARWRGREEFSRFCTERICVMFSEIGSLLSSANLRFLADDEDGTVVPFR
uniref:Uncharacterized protein n=1 Tax=Anguilla anguilla TaxID=7936 RepID=A0A0E9VSQ1_ANGAN